jgi:hypothetical protein
MHIDLVYQQEDERVHQVRHNLRDALGMLDLPPRWAEFRVGGTTPPPAYAAGVATPAVFVEGGVVGKPHDHPPTRAEIFLAVQDVTSRRR